MSHVPECTSTQAPVYVYPIHTGWDIISKLRKIFTNEALYVYLSCYKKCKLFITLKSRHFKMNVKLRHELTIYSL